MILKTKKEIKTLNLEFTAIILIGLKYCLLEPSWENMSSEKEYEELKKLGEKAGVSEIIEVYGDYCKLMEASFEYLEAFDREFSFSTVDTTT